MIQKFRYEKQRQRVSEQEELERVFKERIKELEAQYHELAGESRQKVKDAVKKTKLKLEKRHEIKI